MDNSLNDFDFTDDEIKEQLELLGFKNVSQAKFNSFKEDLRKLIENERSSEESQIFNQRLNKIQKEKLHDNNSWNEDDDDISYSTDMTISSTKPYDDLYTEGNYDSKNKTKTKSIKRKVARKKSFDELVEGNLRTINNLDNNDERNSGEMLRNQDLYLSNSFENLCLNEKNENIDSARSSKLKSNSKISFSNDNQLKSFIRPRSHTSLSTRFEDPSRIRKNNPVRKYQEYSQIWSKQKAPGEKNHNGLRWSIREKMLEKHGIVKNSHQVRNENNYVVPTDKKRQDLRWSIRNAMAYNTE